MQKVIKPQIILILFLLFSNLLFAVDANMFSVELQANKQQAQNSEITVTITNTSAKALRILKWNTPLELTLNANIFNVYGNDKKVPYMGRIVKRGTPKAKDFLLLKSGESVSRILKMNDYYDMKLKGNYSIHYRSNIKFKEENLKKQLTPQKLERTKKLKSSIEINYIPVDKKKTSQKLASNYDTCSASQINIINNAHDAAINITSVADVDMSNEPIPTSAERYVEWFGVANTNRHNTVVNHFNAILSALDEEELAFSCACTEDYFAYVYPSQPYKIYFCNDFWVADLTGTDSQAGTIVHETSHFTIVANTDDHAYGHTGAKELAITNPDDAVFNADSHEYFAENTPYISMNAVGTPATDDYGNIIDDAYPLIFSHSLSISGIIEIGTDTDMFSITIPSSGTLSVYTTDNLDTMGTLYDVNGVLLASNDDEAEGILNFKINKTISHGQYYISVDSYDTAKGSYTLHLEFTPASFNPSIVSYLLN